MATWTRGIARSDKEHLRLRIVRLYQLVCRIGGAAQVLGKQLLRCGTSVAANYRAAMRDGREPSVISKIGIVVEEADESSVFG